METRRLGAKRDPNIESSYLTHAQLDQDTLPQTSIRVPVRGGVLIGEVSSLIINKCRAK